MIKETYFAVLDKIRTESPDALFIAVSRKIPSKNCGCDSVYTSLAPSLTLLRDYKNGNINELGYTELYKLEMKASKSAWRYMNKILELSKSKDVYLVCWEGPGKFCHRHILKEMIEEME
jgi:hypothetical protein